MKLVLTRQARTDLIRLRTFIAEHDPAAAARIAADLVHRIALLQSFPALGRPVPEAPDPETVRDLVVSRYMVRYAVTPATITILRVWHQYEAR